MATLRYWNRRDFFWKFAGLSAPAVLVNMVLLGWLLGVQHVRAPVIFLIVGNLLNIVLDIWLVMGLGWKVQGAAMATAISEYATLLLGLGLAWDIVADVATGLARQPYALAGPEPRHHVALVAATTMFRLADPLCRTPKQRGDGGKCGIDEPSGLLRLRFRRPCLCG